MGFKTKKGRPFKDELTRLEQIFQWFIAPLLEFKPGHVAETVFLEWLFHTRDRHIYRYKSLEEFEIPGLCVVVPNVKVQGVGERRVRRGTMVWVRRDDKIPGIFQLSVHGGVGNQEWVYELNETEWYQINSKLVKLDDDDKDLPRH